MSSVPRDVEAMAVLLVVAGIGHLVRPEPFESIVPRPLPYKRGLVYGSGVVELACSAALLGARTRRVGGYATAALLVGVFPANVQMAVSAARSTRASAWYKAGTFARLPLQAPLIRTALKAARAMPDHNAVDAAH